MNLVIDIGNSQIKCALFEKEALIERRTCTGPELENTLAGWIKEKNIEHGILSHVARLPEGVLDRLLSSIDFLILDHQLDFPFENRYATPETLGVDRLALAAAAVSEYPDRDVLVIDAGSCITFDFVNADRQYQGGAISPGIAMRYRAVHSFTANLPLLAPEEQIPRQADSTVSAIHKGVLNGVICEIDGTIDQYRDQNPNLTVVLTGGDANFLGNNIKSSIFAVPNFLLEGLNRILLYNLEE